MNIFAKEEISRRQYLYNHHFILNFAPCLS